MDTFRPKLALTMGDSNGIGPEILARALSRPELWAGCTPLVIGDVRVYEAARALAPGAPLARPIEDPRAPGEGEGVALFSGGWEAPARRPGVLDPQAGRCAVEWARLAALLALEGTVDAMVTCPLNKEGIHLAGYGFAGHTELVTETVGALDSRLVLFSEKLRILHNTNHCSLREAIALVEAGRLARSIEVAAETLARLGLPRQHIAVCGLNPHAGEAGAFGREEVEIICPTIEACRARGIDCSGPWAADTVFRQMLEGAFDMVVALYHDQGHIAMKVLAMDEAVNVTVGIPIIRTSVAHGTAYDIAGKGIARDDSLCAAIRLARQFALAPRAAHA